MILRANRRKDLISRGILELDPARSCKLSCSTEADIELVVAKIVHMTLDNYRDDPPHDGLLEHASVTVHFTVSRGFTHELVRHRHGSYAQECLTGDTEVLKGRTIKELFDRAATPQGKTHNKTLRLRSCDGNGNIVPNKMVAVTHKGVGGVYMLTTSLGYRIKATADHKFLQPDGSWVELRHLKEGGSLMVNGRLSLLRIPDEELQQRYLTDGLSPQEIADEYSAPYQTVIRRLKWLGIFKKRLNDKNPEKYQRGHSAESVDKMRQRILQQYAEGRAPWNKGVTEDESAAVARQAAALREHHHDNAPGEENSNWKGGVSTSYYMNVVPEGPCELCSNEDAPEIHHIDHNRQNNVRENLVRICVNCHDKLHHGWHVGRRAHPDKIAYINFVGPEDVYDIEMEAPFHNFVANGIVVSNSTRYCNYSKGKFGSSITVIKRSFELEEQIEAWMHAVGEVEHDYMKLIKLGVKPEIARDLLTQATKASITLTANFNSLRNFFRKRCSPRAHPDMRTLMTAFRDDMRKRIPIVFDELI
jgi:thymidylate synthase (FAD)